MYDTVWKDYISTMGKGKMGMGWDFRPQQIIINEQFVNAEAELLNRSVDSLSVENEISLLLRAVSFLDLTTLSADDTRATVTQLCCKAVAPVPKDIVKRHAKYDDSKLTTASVCLYPNRISDAKLTLADLGSALPVAAVAGGFPSGQYPLSTRVSEVAFCVDQGADEIDIVIDRSLVLNRQWEELYLEVLNMNAAGKGKKVKVILATGECGSLDNIFKASLVSMYAGAPFIKTSTGKETINATIPVGIVMCHAIKLFYIMYGVKIGFKPAGGIRTYKDILIWMLLIKKELGSSWLNPSLFRIGASSVLSSIVDRLKELDGVVTKTT
uniref:deoxyribose-phosphate aldolase n=1 Tax=Lygus hesperus TaxID=30085 RepID=A0A0A9XXY8_LYGHE